MNIPDKAYEVFYDKGTIYYVPKRSRYEQEFQELNIPFWLQDLILAEKNLSHNEGYTAVKQEIRKVLGL